MEGEVEKSESETKCRAAESILSKLDRATKN